MKGFGQVFGRRIETRFITTISLIVTTALVGMVVVVAAQLQDVQGEASARMAELLARLAAQTYPAPALEGRNLPEEILQITTAGPEGQVDVVAPTQGTRIPLAPGRLREPVARVRGDWGEAMVLVVPAGSAARPLTVMVALDTRVLRDRARGVVIWIVLVGAAILISCYFLGIFLARMILNPLERFVAAMDTVRAGQLAPILVPEAPENFGQFQDAFNLLLEQIRRVQEMERALLAQDKMATVGRLAAAVAHETRNPLAAISSLTQILADEVREDPRLREYTRVVLKEVARLDKNIAHLLEYARPMRPDFGDFQPHELVRDVGILLKFEARRRGVRLHAVLPEEPLAPALGDANQLKQVLVNLVTNALRATGVGGAVRVGVEDTEDGGLRFWVEDEGPGVAEEIRERIFLPFFSEERGGTGLGLAVARKIVESHCGTIWVESRAEGPGARFVVDVPRLETPPEAIPEPVEGPSPWPRR